MTINQIRNLFPHISTGQIYFNHAALGPWSVPVVNRINEYITERTGAMVMNYESFVKWNNGARNKLAELLNADQSRFGWIDNVSNALNIVANGLEWKTGDRIILNDIEFPANIYPFLNLKKSGVEIDFAKSRNGIVDLEDIEKLVTPNTKLISISMVQFTSGYRADINSIGEFCRQKGIIFCVDAIQAVGAVDVDLKNTKVDFLAGGTQKWLMSSQGLSYFYINEELQNRIQQKNVGWISVENAWDFLNYDLTLLKNADRYQTGTLNAFGIAIFDAALELYMKFKIENPPESGQDCELRILENTNYFINKLVELGLNPILKNVPEKNRAGIVTFKHDRAKQLFVALEKKNIFAALREGLIRFSPHFYNTKEEIDLVAEEIKKLI
jgi:selenocysteine lyase/cysteine desulfurase